MDDHEGEELNPYAEGLENRLQKNLEHFEKDANEIEYVDRGADWHTFKDLDGSMFDVDHFAKPKLRVAKMYW